MEGTDGYRGDRSSFGLLFLCPYVPYDSTVTRIGDLIRSPRGDTLRSVGVDKYVDASADDDTGCYDCLWETCADVQSGRFLDANRQPKPRQSLRSKIPIDE